MNASLVPTVISLTSRKPFFRSQWRFMPTTLAVVLGLTGSGLLMQTIAPAAVHAYTGTVNVTIDVQPSETYDTLIRRAEAIARAATQRSFDRDILMTDVAIVIIAQHAASTVPVLSLATTRSQWRRQPDPRRWATYYSTSKALLGLDKAPTATTTVTQPTITNSTPSPTATPTATPTSTAAPTSTAPTSTQPRSTTPNTPTTPTNASGGTATDSPQTPAATSPSPILPQRIPTPANIGK